MIYEIAIWKLVLIGLGVASGSFILGFIIAAICAASGKASKMEEAIGLAMWNHAVQDVEKKWNPHTIDSKEVPYEP